MDFNQARKNMVDGQLTPNKIVNGQVIERFLKIPREYFVDVSFKNMAYRDNPVKIAINRYMFPPMVTAHMVQALNPKQNDSVLVVASGTGYTASIISSLAGSVYGVEDSLSLLEIGRRALLDASCKSVILSDGNPSEGLPDKAPYSKIIVDVEIEHVPDALFDQLENGGTLVAVLKVDDTVSALTKFEKNENGKISHFTVREVVSIPTHPSFKKPQGFEF